MNTISTISSIVEFYVHECIPIDIIRHFFGFTIVKICEQNPVDETSTIELRDYDTFKNVNNDIIIHHTNQIYIPKITLMPVESNYQEIIDEDISMSSSDLASIISDSSDLACKNEITIVDSGSPTMIEISSSEDESVCETIPQK